MSEKRTEQRKKILNCAIEGDVEGYIRESEKYAYDYLPEEVIKRYVVPEEFNRRIDYAEWLQVMLHNDTVMRSFSESIVLDMVYFEQEPKDYMIEEVRKCMKLGYRV